MPNKQIQHTELDNAIKNSLLSHESEAGVEWREIEMLLPKKTTVVKSPLSDFSFSLNSLVGVVSTGSVANLRSTLMLAKKWSVALYVVAGTITVTAGSYFLYHSLNKNTSSGPSVTTSVPAPVTKEIVKQNENKSTVNNGVTSGSPVTTSINPATDNATQKDQTTIQTEPSVTENTKSTDASLVNKVATQYEKAPSADEPVQLKTGEALQKDTENFPSDTNANDTNGDGFEHYHEKAGVKKGKVLYYKENLSLDKLEQEIVPENKDSVK